VGCTGHLLTFLPLDLSESSHRARVCIVERNATCGLARPVYARTRLRCTVRRCEWQLGKHSRRVCGADLFQRSRSQPRLTVACTAPTWSTRRTRSSHLTTVWAVPSVNASVYLRSATRHAPRSKEMTPWQDEGKGREFMRGQERLASTGRLRPRAAHTTRSGLLGLERRRGPLSGRRSREQGAQPPAPTLHGRRGSHPRSHGAQSSGGTHMPLLKQPVNLACVAPSAGTSYSQEER
jgi:hypothetical protein